METYLNLAHRSHRKAAFYSSNQLFYQAIYHHKAASEYLEKGIIQTHCDNIRASLISQRNHHLTQIELLTRRLALQLNSTAKTSDGRPVDSPSDPTQALISAQSHFNSHRMAAEQLEQKYRELYQIMNDQDELIQSLVDSSDSKPKGSPKKTKDDKEIAEQLLVINEKVRKWITTLVERLEKSANECKTLREDNEKLKKEITNLKSQTADQSQFIPELPSLQPPTLFY